jgi:hypothetical protein
VKPGLGDEDEDPAEKSELADEDEDPAVTPGLGHPPSLSPEGERGGTSVS